MCIQWAAFVCLSKSQPQTLRPHVGVESNIYSTTLATTDFASSILIGSPRIFHTQVGFMRKRLEAVAHSECRANQNGTVAENTVKFMATVFKTLIFCMISSHTKLLHVCLFWC